MLFAFAPEGEEARPVWFIRSEDEGESWSDPVRVSEPKVKTAIWNDTAIVTSTGRIVLPTYYFVGNRRIVPEGVSRSVGLFGDE